MGNSGREVRSRLGLAHSATHALAGAYGGLPLKWESILEFKTPQDMSEVVAVLRKHLPSSHDILTWLRLIQTDGAVYHPRPIPGSRRRNAAISEAAEPPSTWGRRAAFNPIPAFLPRLHGDIPCPNG